MLRRLKRTVFDLISKARLEVGAIDGSHISVSGPAEDVVNHTCQNGHGYTSQNVLAM